MLCGGNVFLWLFNVFVKFQIPDDAGSFFHALDPKQVFEFYILLSSNQPRIRLESAPVTVFSGYWGLIVVWHQR